MVNFNGELRPKDTFFFNHENRGLRYGDSLFETIRAVNNELFFWEDHYLRLMSSMRILRMEIPMDFTMEFLEGEILKTLEANALQKKPARVRLTIFRNNGGLYAPLNNGVSFVVEAEELESPFYTIEDKTYVVELFKDFYVNPDMLSSLKTNNRIINVVGSIYAKENECDNCFLLNTGKNVVETLNGNLFLVKGNAIKTPPIKDGCLGGIIRKKLIGIIENLEDYTLQEASVSPFELLRADELFMTNSIAGIQPITKYRKREYNDVVAKNLLGRLNALARLERT